MPMIGVSEKELDRDRKRFNKFIQDNTFPSYDFVVNDVILKNKEFDQFAEYGTPNHQWIKEIYENVFNDDVVKDNGKEIYERGSLWTMQCNYSTLLDVVNTLLNRHNNMKHDDKVLIFYNIKNIVSRGWHGIGEWKH